jgi:hypothetical protein
MRLVETRIERTARTAALVGTLEWRTGRRSALRFRFPAEYGEFLLDSADPFLACLLPAAMMRGEPLEILPPVDEVLLSRVERIAQILLAWNAEEFGFRPLELRAAARAEAKPRLGSATLSLFSGGVDSFYSLVKWHGRADPITHVLFMKGLEQPLERTADAEGAIALATRAAALYGARAIAGETNLRSFFPELNYERSYQAAALSSAALALSGGVRRLIFPSSFGYSQLSPWGSHPLLDELFSSRRLQIVHDGCEVRRVEKVALLSRSPQALQHLRVCLENRSGPFNCGRCRKCVRTMVALELCGALRSAPLFPSQLPDDLATLLTDDHETFLSELVDFARAHGADRALQARIERALRIRRLKQAVRTLLAEAPVVGPRWSAIRDWRRSRATPPAAPARASPAGPGGRTKPTRRPPRKPSAVRAART